MTKLNLAFSAIIVLFVSYIFLSENNHDVSQDSLDVSNNNQPRKNAQQLKFTSPPFNSSNTDELSQVQSNPIVEIKSSTQETPPSYFDSNITIEEAVNNERGLREDIFWNSNYGIYADSELRELAEQQDPLAQLTLSVKISEELTPENYSKQLLAEGEKWARRALQNTNTPEQETLFFLAIEQMSTYAELRHSKIESYAWSVLGAERGSAMMKKNLDLTREKILKLNTYETELAKRMAQVLESMIAENQLGN